MTYTTLVDFLTRLFECPPERLVDFLQSHNNVKRVYSALHYKKLSIPYLGESYRFYLRGFHLEPTSADPLYQGSHLTINKYLERERGIILKHKALPSAVSPGRGKMLRFPLELIKVERQYTRWDAAGGKIRRLQRNS